MKNMKPFIAEIIVGIILMGISLFVDSSYYSNMVFFAGFGIAAGAVVQIIRITYWQSPKRQEAYEAKKREAHINSVDERKQYLRMKAGHITYQIMTFLLLILSLMLALIRAEAWIIGMMYLLFILQWVIGMIAYRILQKKM